MAPAIAGSPTEQTQTRIATTFKSRWVKDLRIAVPSSAAKTRTGGETYQRLKISLGPASRVVDNPSCLVANSKYDEALQALAAEYPRQAQLSNGGFSVD